MYFGQKITSVTLTFGGQFYVVGDVLSADTTTIGGSGSGFSIAVTAISNATGSLGTMSTQNANNVAITGGTIAGTTVNGNTVGSNSVGARTVSSSSPTGGSNGDIWYKI